MPFTTKEFPGRTFSTMSEFQEARKLQETVEKELAQKLEEAPEKRITVQVIPASPEALERRVIALEAKIRALMAGGAEDHSVKRPPTGTILRGETKGRVFSLEVLPDSYLCSDGEIYPTLSAAALAVSGNRRSGWKFWKDENGLPIGETTGRFGSA